MQLETPRLILKPLTLEDAADIYEYAKDLEVARYTSWEAHKSIEDAHEFVSRVLKYSELGKTECWALREKKNPSQVIGVIDLIKTQDHECRLDYVLHKGFWGQGLMNEAGKAMLERAFKVFQVERVSSWCLKENDASAKVMQNLGMVYEGCFRSKMLCKGKLCDITYYAVLKKDWMKKEG